MMKKNIYHNYNPDDWGIGAWLQSVLGTWRGSLVQYIFVCLVLFVMIILLISCLKNMWTKAAASVLIVRPEGIMKVKK